MPSGLGALDGGASVLAALDRRLLKDDPAPLAVALSGGGDSLALLRRAEDWARAARRPLLALTVDHRLSADSAAWTDFAAARAAESGARFRALAWEGPKSTTGLPAAARAARHALLARAAREAGASVILVGHTADDVAETDAMRAGDARGIGRLREWSPSPVWPQGRGVMLLRPMLGVRRAVLRRWLTSRGEVWLEDPANEDARYARVRARLSPLAPGVCAIEGEGEEIAALADLVSGEAEGGLRLPIASLQAPAGPAAAHVLSVAVLCAGGGSTPPRRAGVDRLLARLLADEGGAATLRGARIERRGEDVVFRREPGDRTRNPRPDMEGVVDGRFIPRDDGPHWLVLQRLRAACFLVRCEADLAAQNHFFARNQARGSSVVTTISARA